ncbi:glycosyltransferase [Candidatus Nomurabacteria bacterium]|uniref:Glycosyltransferase n=1 Tax=candidate division WWE3 bacterium TaxID=2053526 RepID=A0A955DZ88_UNCKA|nr:glycosyltransferase [candidate division WWE3 bacterium]MCB9824139.1 glycosyltransferase [Candidatus Nomurabacteria bacterium]MCB9826890.1 glycosyltransferase [Candidatus Nomurabacteria bacterium]MCB9828080.1 glycosyltransferase [Candidatus Nomurabacteria bacterium]
MIVLASHAYLVDDQVFDVLFERTLELLIKKNHSFVFVRNYIYGERRSEVLTYKNGVLVETATLATMTGNLPLAYFSQVLVLLKVLSKYRAGARFIAANPLNAFSGILFKIFSPSSKVVFYNTDYSDRRFDSWILNFFFRFIERVCVMFSDYIWCVSSRIFDKRLSQGVPADRLVFVPNVPDIQVEISAKKKLNHVLITSGILSDQQDYFGLFDAVKVLKVKYPSILLKIYGNGDKEEMYKNYVKSLELEETVLFHDFIPHKEYLLAAMGAGIGIALYNGSWGFNYYGDSTKCREFFAFGVPVITTDTHSTVKEIVDYECGVVCDVNSTQYVEAYDEIMSRYEYYSSNCLRLAKTHENILGKSILSFISE